MQQQERGGHQGRGASPWRRWGSRHLPRHAWMVFMAELGSYCEKVTGTVCVGGQRAVWFVSVLVVEMRSVGIFRCIWVFTEVRWEAMRSRVSLYAKRCCFFTVVSLSQNPTHTCCVELAQLFFSFFFFLSVLICVTAPDEPINQHVLETVGPKTCGMIYLLSLEFRTFYSPLQSVSCS